MIHEFALSPSKVAPTLPVMAVVGGFSINVSGGQKLVNFDQFRQSQGFYTTLLGDFGPTNNVSKQLLASFRRVVVDMDASERAIAAAAQIAALSFLPTLGSVPTPWANVSDDGIVVFEWRGAKGDLALLFHGDGDVTISKSELGSTYLTAPRTVRISSAISKEVKELIRLCDV